METSAAHSVFYLQGLFYDDFFFSNLNSYKKKKTVKCQTSPTFSCFNERCLKHSLGPWTGYKAVRIPNHRENHGRGHLDPRFDFPPDFLYLVKTEKMYG